MKKASTVTGKSGKDYIFTFLGEFGYEMFNWQGVVRKWATLYKLPQDRIIICGRKGLQPVYEFADEYIDISELESYKKSTAGIYIAVLELALGYDQEGCSKLNRKCVDDIKVEVQEFLQETITLHEPQWIWSSDPQYLEDCKFGKIGPQQGGIYSKRRTPWSFLDVRNNMFAKIKSHNQTDWKMYIQSKYNLDLNDDYILCQSAKRDSFMTTKSKELIDHDQVMNEISKHRRVVYLNFDTGRVGDCKSTDGSSNFHSISCDGFEQQSCLINNASDCVFFTEGDFRSHLYVPPFLGKDIKIVAHSEVFGLHSAPINFWNQEVFTFGGQMIPYSYETLNTQELIRDLS